MRNTLARALEVGLTGTDIEANRIATATLLRRALGGDSLEAEPEWPDGSDDPSVEIALDALDEYLNDVPRDDAAQEGWRLELGRMADSLSRGEDIDTRPLAGWQRIAISPAVKVLVLVAFVVLIGWTLWQTFH
jgi:hypothetical protein